MIVANECRPPEDAISNKLGYLRLLGGYGELALRDGTRNTMGDEVKERCVHDLRRLRGMSTGAGRSVVGTPFPFLDFCANIRRLMISYLCFESPSVRNINVVGLGSQKPGSIPE